MSSSGGLESQGLLPGQGQSPVTGSVPSHRAVGETPALCGPQCRLVVKNAHPGADSWIQIPAPLFTSSVTLNI